MKLEETGSLEKREGLDSELAIAFVGNGFRLSDEEIENIRNMSYEEIHASMGKIVARSPEVYERAVDLAADLMLNQRGKLYKSFCGGTEERKVAYLRVHYAFALGLEKIGQKPKEQGVAERRLA